MGLVLSSFVCKRHVSLGLQFILAVCSGFLIADTRGHRL